MRRVFWVFLIVALAGCAGQKDFSQGLKGIEAINLRYNTTMETYPGSMQGIDSMSDDFMELKKLRLNSGQEPFGYIIDYRLVNLEAEKLYMQSQRYGSAGTTKLGFACKPRPLIIESAQLRNMSALKGFEGIEILRKLIAEYPEEAKLAGLSEKNALFTNATFYLVQTEAQRDSRTINRFCPANETLELYREEFRKKTNYSEDFIKNVAYEDAVEIWKKLRGIE